MRHIGHMFFVCLFVANENTQCAKVINVSTSFYAKLN